MEITMAFESKRTPGKKFGSIFAQKHYDENHTEDGMHSESPEHEKAESPEFEAGEREEMNEGEQEKEQEEKTGEEQHPVVAEHGPAHKTVVTHDHAAGRHTVVSHHKDGHVHTNVHEHAHKAHDEARQLAAVPPAGKEENEEKIGFNHEDKGQQGAPSEEDGFAMPNLV
jgi:hypothetical protein